MQAADLCLRCAATDEAEEAAEPGEASPDGLLRWIKHSRSPLIRESAFTDRNVQY
jgi:hypothetical protein